MKKAIIIVLILSSVILVNLIQCKPGKETIKTPPVTAPAWWFKDSSTPAPDDAGPFLNLNANDSTFHLWAWQKFLSLTRTAEPRAPFEGLIQIDTAINPIAGCNYLNDTLQLVDSLQAFSHLPVYDKQNKALLYSIMVNREMFDFQHYYLSVFKRIFKNCYSLHLPDSLTDLRVQDSLHAHKLDSLNYPVGALVLKTSWIRCSDIPNPDDYYTTWAVVSTAKGIHRERVALLGMHVVGRVSNHPEFIWSTFEHDSIAPNYPWQKKWPQNTKDTVVSQNSYLLYDGKTPIQNCLDTSRAKHNLFTNVFNMFPLGEARSFVYHIDPKKSYPADTLPNRADSLDHLNMQSINASVHQQLKKTKGPWSHYFYKGAIWLNAVNHSFGPGQSSFYVLTNKSLLGTRAFSNITMETYTQLDYMGVYD
ncbi:MAG TPA: hypothetical protein VNZ86_20750, partial [Bacteroidia bacterium]|nr:hypothetical protein [Bacteroidia bacterium]